MDEVFKHIKTVSRDVTEIKRLFEFVKMINCPEKGQTGFSWCN